MVVLTMWVTGATITLVMVVLTIWVMVDPTIWVTGVTIIWVMVVLTIWVLIMCPMFSGEALSSRP